MRIRAEVIDRDPTLPSIPPWLRRELAWFAFLLAFGVFVLPGLVYAVGTHLLGEYSPEGGAGLFYRDLYAAAAAPEPWAWLLLAGPWLAVLALRMLWLPLRGGAAEPDEDD